VSLLTCRGKQILESNLGTKESVNGLLNLDGDFIGDKLRHLLLMG
jgi:hypothetical protein